MHITALSNLDDLQGVVLTYLKNIGVKHRVKKLNVNKHSHHLRKTPDGRLFRKPLHYLHMQHVILDSGPRIEVPVFLVEACQNIEQNLQTEGLFRKAGSNARQKQIKMHLECGRKIGSQHHVIDIANILKLFFRELPEPLLPFVYHDIFLRCLLLKERQIEAVLLTCLLLPQVHLHTLEYTMQFFQKVTSYSDVNKMDATNLAIILTPSIMPVEEKIGANTGTRLEHHVRVVEILLQNASQIGMLPGDIVCQFPSAVCRHSNDLEISNEEINKSKKKKKRRSGSLTRMLNGLRKMVGRGSPDTDENNLITSTPDFSTPVMKSTKKRKVSAVSGNAFSNKKKQQVLKSLPQGIALSSAHFTPTPTSCVSRDLYLTPQVCVHPNPTTSSKSPTNKSKNGRHFPPRTKQDSSGSNLQQEISSSLSVEKKQSGAHQVREESSWLQRHTANIEKRWSTGAWRRKRRLDPLNLSVTPNSSFISATSEGRVSLGTLNLTPNGVDLSDCEAVLSNTDKITHTNTVFTAEESSVVSSDSADFVRIPKSEFEAIKNRVSAIEDRISQEFGNVEDSPDLQCVAFTEAVQTAYERTLEEHAKLDNASCQDSGTTEQLARRLSRELRIRRSLDGARPIRSPSARKIGSLRRRSRELEAQKQRRNSWASPSTVVGILGSGLRRGRPNTVMTGLRRPCRRASSFGGREFSPDLPGSAFVSNIMDTTCVNDDSSPSKGSHKETTENHICLGLGGQTDKALTDDQNCLKSHAFTTIKDNCNAENLQKTPNGGVWTEADDVLGDSCTNVNEVPVTGRESVARIRSQNAGMVLKRMRLFDGQINIDNSYSGYDSRTVKHKSSSQSISPNSSSSMRFNSGQYITSERTSKVTLKNNISPKKRAQTKSPKDSSNKCRHKHSKSPLSKEQNLINNVQTPRGRAVRKSQSCRVSKSQNSHCRFSPTAPIKSDSDGKENLSAAEEIFFRRKASAVRVRKYREKCLNKASEITLEQSYKDSSILSPLKDRNRGTVATVGICADDVFQNTPTPFIKTSLLIRSGKGLRPYVGTVGAAGRPPVTPVRAMTPVNITPLRQSPRLAQTSCKPLFGNAS